MKRLHVIHSKTINDIDLKSRGKLVSLLETEVIGWAQKNNEKAYTLTLPLQVEYQKNPNNGEVSNKYFKYLRRLLELKLDHTDETTDKNKWALPATTQELATLLNLESVRIPEYISCTQMQLYTFCERKWFYAYALRLPQPVTSQLHMGKSIDLALNFYYEEKIKGKVPPRQAVYASFYEAFEIGRESVVWGDDDPKHLYSSGPAIIDAYLDRFDSITKAIDIQTECNIHLDNGGRLLGYIDILEEDAIIDTKTAAKPWDDKGRFQKHKQELQPLAYSLHFLETYEKMPREFRYQIVIKPKEGEKPKTQLISFEVKKYEVEAFKRKAQQTWDEIMERLPKGINAFPAQAEQEKVGVLCTQEWCPFAKNCMDKGLKIPLKWVKKTEASPGYHIYGDEEKQCKS